MPRTRYSLLRATAVAAAALALALSGASAASAFGPVDVTITPSTTGENPLTNVAYICPATSVSAVATWTGTQGGAPYVLGPSPLALVAGEFDDDYYLESYFDRDTDVTFSVDCSDAGSLVTGSDSTVYHVPTINAASSAPASLAANADLVVTGNCGTAVSIDSLTVYAYQQPGNILIATFPHFVAYNNVGNYTINLGTPTALAVPVGDSVQAQVICHSTAPAPHNTSLRSTSTTVAAAALAPAAGLPNSGVEPAGAIAGSGVLLLAGAVLLLVRRSRLA